MTDTYILDDEGRPVPEPDVHKWGEWFHKANRQIGETMFPDIRISTVFIGVNHQYFDGPPLVFETMVFGGPLDGEMDRYSMRDEALAGHSAMVERVRRALH